MFFSGVLPGLSILLSGQTYPKQISNQRECFPPQDYVHILTEKLIYNKHKGI